ncbi:possible light-dependent protochlorophyllide oxido-reductase [Prochlorococcus marinus str. MIT 9515]|uniref:Possible light-dependent protochlorophyllide oxido-reductase n=1 Tax=Prochlorococcus marinus (strain MIT 9515) TaxID=167542 RepID=A2BVU8_PROM5|nr:SDR family NAD(P)-dependent oxidoreductase [Prochlorococcus marinus]ABM71909.1 possible light-dependent protochlorophyllide oxido-reductase [Prochlorococcus marinus str. MIT 9515]
MLKDKNILITGGNSGIGFYATINLLKAKNNLYIPIRSIPRKDQFFFKLLKYFDKKYLDKYLNLIENIDLANLRNIEILRDYLNKKNVSFDVIILNAGLQYTGSFYPKVSKQGIELTFAVNHLAHFYLVNSLIGLINNKKESRIIITSSDVHDPKSSGGNVGKKAGLNNLVNFKQEITGKYLNFNSDKAYKNSKLCNILFAKELSKRLQIKAYEVAVITWAPGLVIPNEDLGFFRYSKKFNFFGYIIFSIIAKNILGISENVENAGKLLSEIVTDPEFNNIKYLHLSNKLVFFKKHKLLKSEISEEANKSDLALRLWNLSEELCQSFGFVSLNI